VELLVKSDQSGSPDTLARIRRVFIDSLHLNLGEEDFSYETRLDESVGLDSVAVLEFVTALEREFGITFESKMLTVNAVRDLKALTAYVDRRTARLSLASAGESQE
jgi:acyl carrier protein